MYLETHVQLKWDNIDPSKVYKSKYQNSMCLCASAIIAKVMRIHTKLTAIKLAFSLAITDVYIYYIDPSLIEQISRVIIYLLRVTLEISHATRQVGSFYYCSLGSVRSHGNGYVHIHLD